jgi:hypothetical protein
MLLMKIKNPQFLKRPWLLTIYTVIGGICPIYFAGPEAHSIEVIGGAVGAVAAVNAWFYLSLWQTLRNQKGSDSST